MRSRTLKLGPVFALILTVASATDLFAQVKSPPPPAMYHVDARYRIRADRDERVRQFRAMTANLKRLGFVADPNPDADLDLLDPTAELLAGTITSANVAEFIADPRIQTILLRRPDQTLPDDPAAMVPVQFTITSGLIESDQLRFHEQVVAQLKRLGFVENIGYDHRRFSRISGLIPAGRVPNLVRDLRDQPSGWFVPSIPREQLNAPFRDLLPIRIVELLPASNLSVTPVSLPPAKSPKFQPDVVLALADPASANKPLRVELLTREPIAEGARGLRAAIKNNLPTLSLEGAFGSFATVVVAKATDLEILASRPEVLSIRLPRSASLFPTTPAVQPSWDALADSGANALVQSGQFAKGVRVVVIGTDFRAAAELTKRKPELYRQIDLTAELSNSVEPLPYTLANNAGTDAAAAVRLVAPEAEIILVRVEPTALHQLMTILRSTLGDGATSLAYATRTEDLIRESDTLATRRELVVEQYRKAFSDLRDDAEPTRRRRAASDAFAKLKADEGEFKRKFDRLSALTKSLAELRGAGVIVNTLSWDDGYPMDAMHAVAMLFTNRLASESLTINQRKSPTQPIWIQAASLPANRAWSNAFLDADDNGVMEFSRSNLPLVKDTWTRELNFLSLQQPDGKKLESLPANAKLRLTIQWREPRAGLTEFATDSVYLLNLILLKQLDPNGEKVSADSLGVVASSIGSPTQLLSTNGAAVYEQTLEVTLPSEGRFALRVEGQYRDPNFPRSQHAFEFQPRITVTGTDPAALGQNRIVFDTYSPKAIGVGIPGDSSNVLTVGNGTGYTGAGPGITLRMKPDLIVPEAKSPSQAAGYAAGIVADLLGAGVEPNGLTKIIVAPPQPGTVTDTPPSLKLVPEVLQALPRASGGR